MQGGDYIGLGIWLLAIGIWIGSMTVEAVTKTRRSARISQMLNNAVYHDAFEWGYFAGNHGLPNKTDTFGDPITRAGYSEGYTLGLQEHTAAFRSCHRAYSEETN